MLQIFDVGYMLHQFSPKKGKKIADFLAWKTLYKSKNYSDEKMYACWQAVSPLVNEKLFLNVINKVSTSRGTEVKDAISFYKKEQADTLREKLFSDQNEKELFKQWEDAWKCIRQCDRERFPNAKRDKMKFSLRMFKSLIYYFSLKKKGTEHGDMKADQSEITEEEIDYLFKLISLDPATDKSLTREVFHEKVTDKHIEDIETLHPSGALLNIEKVKKLIEKRKQLFSYFGKFLIGVISFRLFAILKRRTRLTIKQILLLLYIILAELKFIFS